MSIVEFLTDPNVWASFLALSAMEIVLGIDNVVFISVMVQRLPKEQQLTARRVGLSLALVFRVIMLAFIAWFIHMTVPIVTVGDYAFSWRDLILLAGGLFLLFKGTREIHDGIEGEEDENGTNLVVQSLTAAIVQIAIIDLVFSVDSMIAAVAVAIAVMYFASGPVAAFIERHPTTKMLALSFLLLIGAALVADAFHFHIPRGYIYFAMAFSAGVEVINVLATRKRRKTKAAEKKAKRAAKG